ncbi:MAG TPA: hypothetical protein VFZ91_15820 [Allosphingosinicella sp.]
MRIPTVLAAALVLAAPAAAQKLGARTASPAEILGQIAPADPEAEMNRIAAAAAAHPLGTLENPVRVGGPEGARAYIARLRCADGSHPRAAQHGRGGVGAYGTVTQLYPLDCGGAAPGRAELVVDLYHEEHREDRAPAGFTIAPR